MRTIAQWWPLPTLLLVALTMGIEFGHVLELGPKLRYPPELYLRLNTSLYAWFGPPVGAVIYFGSILATGVLTWLSRRRGAALALTATAFGLQVVAFTTFLTLIEPVNVRFRALAPGEVPADFATLRNQWELTHALGFVLFTAAFVLLLVSILMTQPAERGSRRSTARPPRDEVGAVVYPRGAQRERPR